MDDVPLVPGDGEHGVRIVAQDLEILRNDGVFILSLIHISGL